MAANYFLLAQPDVNGLCLKGVCYSKCAGNKGGF